MSRKGSIILVIVMLAALLAIVGSMILASLLGRQYNWYPHHYSIRTKQPYDIQYTYKLVKKTASKRNFELMNKPFLDKLDTALQNANYIFIGRQNFIDTTSAQHLLKFVENGNTAFISTKVYPSLIMHTINEDNWYSYQYESIYDSMITINYMDFSTGDIDFYFYQKNEPARHYWDGIPGLYFQNEFEPRGFNEISRLDSGLVNYYSISHGKGKFLFHTSPELFGNYYLIRDDGFEYINNTLRKLNKGEIFWDLYNTRYHYKAPPPEQDPTPLKGGPLSYILSQKSLRWAFYTILLALILFIVFHTKREQKAIRLLPVNKNTSIEFAKAVGTVHYRAGNLKETASEIMRLFQGHVRNRYGISTNMDNQKLAEIIAKKSNVPRKNVNQIFYQESKMKHYTTDLKEELISLYNAVDYFYKHCK